MGTHTDLERAKNLLNGDITCVFLKGESVFTSTQRGIAPLLGLIDRGISAGYAAADKIVGKAAALLYLYLGVSAVYGEVMTEEAYKLLSSHGVDAEYALSAQKIINRRGDGLCPMEETVKDISSPALAVPALREKLKRLRGE